MTDNDISRPLTIPEAKRGRFQALTRVQGYSWPTLALAAGVLLGAGTLIALALLSLVPYPVAGVALGLIFYFSFSIVHDGIHRAVSSNVRFNDGLAGLPIVLVAPYANLALLRWAHMEHHRFTNEENDPDSWSHGHWLTLPFRWMSIDFAYFIRVLRSQSTQARKVRKSAIARMAFGCALVSGLIAAGYGWEYFWLSFLPSRILFLGMGFTFFWLPHNHWSGGSGLEQSKNFSAATVVRQGYEWLLNPLLQYQNYHLVHHMWPTTPFYNNQRVWQLLEPEFRQRDLALARAFELFPWGVVSGEQGANRGLQS